LDDATSPYKSYHHCVFKENGAHRSQGIGGRKKKMPLFHSTVASDPGYISADNFCLCPR